MFKIDDFQRINKISKDYKKIVAKKHPGMKHLVSSLEFSCKWHKNFVDDRIPKYYDQYKPGSLIFVDFGVNVGSEFSKPHFAIVLNKNDNKRSSVLTVVPLTSKYSNHALGINDSIFNNSIIHLNDSLNEIKDEVTKYKTELEKTEYDIQNTAQGLGIDIENKNPTEMCLEMLDYSRNLDDSSEIINIVFERIDTLLRDMGRLKAKITEQENCKKMIVKVLTQYIKYDKKSYACYKNITTISKNRIKKINRFDPSGSIKVSKSTFDLIKENALEHIF